MKDLYQGKGLDNFIVRIVGNCAEDGSIKMEIEKKVIVIEPLPPKLIVYFLH